MPIIEFDDLAVGRFVAVHSLRKAAIPPIETPQDLFAARENRPRSPVTLGRPVEVMALNAPFVLARAMLPGGGFTGPVLLDTRDLRLMPVPSEMIDVLRDRFEVSKPRKSAVPPWAVSGSAGQVSFEVDSGPGDGDDDAAESEG